MSDTIDFYWDIGSTNSYFALKLLVPLAERYQTPIIFHPFNLGYVFRANNYVLMEEPKAKLINRRDDLMRWAKKYQLPFQVPTEFPIKTSRALRGAIAMRKWDKELDFINEIFSAYWEQGDASVAEYGTLRRIAAKIGADPDEFEAECESDEVRQALIDSTDTALERGVFGVPTTVVGEELYWGKDRMDFIEDHLAQLSSQSKANG
ncbi:MAG: 2-hydroxychromene-2-carboxylate isomerase [Porticoccaceae bacterium]|nr:2-hydroxychromene-2-carboxylate isomerase [Porticoccaceae bacterium]